MPSAWKHLLLVVAVLLAAVAGWLAVREPSPVETAREVATHVDRSRVDVVRPATASAPEAATDRPASRVAEAKREAVARRVAEALERGGRSAHDVDATHDDPAASEVDDDAAAEPRPPIRNRMGDDDPWGDALVKRLGDDFGPLTDECIADVRERIPELAGMVAFDVTVAGDADLGGVVESATPSADNEIDDPAFVECMRESMLSTVLPAPPDTDRRGFMLSLRVEDEP